MIKESVAHLRPTSIEGACAALRADPGAVVAAGGTVLVPEFGRRERDASAIVDLHGLGLDRIEVRDTTVVIGALATYAQVERLAELREASPMLHQLAHGVTGGAQIRNQGTLGGSACRAMPSSDVPTALASLDTVVLVQGPDGERQVAFVDFLLGAGQTALGPGEVAISFVVRRAERGEGQAYVKLKLSESSWPIVTAGASVRSSGDARRAVLAVGGLAPVPIRLELDLDEVPGRAELDEALRDGRTELWSDELAEGRYRERVAGSVARRALTAAAAAQEQGPDGKADR